MPRSVPLTDIVSTLEARPAEMNIYLDRESGEMHVVTAEDESALEASDAGRLVALPSSFDIHEWGLMEQFGRSSGVVRTLSRSRRPALDGGRADGRSTIRFRLHDRPTRGRTHPHRRSTGTTRHSREHAPGGVIGAG
jgi:hypothetical protein